MTAIMAKIFNEEKAQTSLEMLLILGAAIIVATTVGLLFKYLANNQIQPQFNSELQHTIG